MRVGFFSNQLGLRGTEVVMWDYANLNETHLCNQSVIISYALRPGNADQTPESYARFERRFPVVYLDREQPVGAQLDAVVRRHILDALYVAKWGLRDAALATACPTLVHSVFSMAEPHGDAYLGVSPYVARKFNRCPSDFLPNVCTLAQNADDMRVQLGIPANAVVFGRHGGYDTFDLPEAQEAVAAMAAASPHTYFLFLNTRPFLQYSARNVIHLPCTCDPVCKRRFLNTCDAMLHARSDGETWGCACAEFALLRKPVITYVPDRPSYDAAHLEMLGGGAVVCRTREQLDSALESFTPHTAPASAYEHWTPDACAERLQVILNKLHPKR